MGKRFGYLLIAAVLLVEIPRFMGAFSGLVASASRRISYGPIRTQKHQISSFCSCVAPMVYLLE